MSVAALALVVGLGTQTIAKADMISNAHNCIAKNVAQAERLKYRSHGVKNLSGSSVKVWCSIAFEPLSYDELEEGKHTVVTVVVHMPAGSNEVPSAMFYVSDPDDGKMRDSAYADGRSMYEGSESTEDGMIYMISSVDEAGAGPGHSLVDLDSGGFPGVQVELPAGGTITTMYFEAVDAIFMIDF